MKFFFPDSQDLVDPTFDFHTEERSETRLRQRDDLYAHEVFSPPPFDGILVSKAIVDGLGGIGARYTIAQRQRLLRHGVRSFFRLDRDAVKHLETMGDCGAFTYVKERFPPYSVEEVAEFYRDAGFDYGVSVDHVILEYKSTWDESLPGLDLVPPETRERQRITLELAEQFLRLHQDRGFRFVPVGVAQGWSPKSYAASVQALQEIGYTSIAVGGLVPLKTHEILGALQAISEVRRESTRLHLFGVTRCEEVASFQQFGVTSFDSTSPLRQAFKDDKDNYYTLDRTYVALRVPQVEGNAKLEKRIRSGELDLATARRLEQACLDALNRFDRDDAGLEETLVALIEYERFCGAKRDHREVYREVLTDRPWKNCKCEICTKLGIHVIVFRGAERNRRRGFHNVWMLRQRLDRELARAADPTPKKSGPSRRKGTKRGEARSATACN